MRIAFLLQDTGVLYGAERATLDLARGLKESGYTVLVLLIQETRLGLVHSPLAEEFRNASIETRAFSAQGRFSLALARQVRKVCQDRKVDVLHTIGYKADIHGGVASGWGRFFPIVSTVHGWLFRAQIKERFYQWLNLHALRQFTNVVVLSRWYETYLRQAGAKNVALIPTGINLNEIVSEKKAEELFKRSDTPLTFGMLGRLSHEKGNNFFLNVVELWGRTRKDSSVRFWMAGDGPDKRKLEACIHEKKLSSCVEMTGFLSQEAFFRHVHVLVQCSRMENLSYSVLEAMAWMRPVIASKVGGLTDLVQHGETGWLVDGFCEKNWAQWFEHVYLNRDLVEQMGKQARNVIGQHFSRDLMLERHRHLYETMRRVQG